MIENSFFLQLVIILFSARLLGELSARFKIPSVIGELMAGVILGPSLLGWLAPIETIHLLAEIGVVLLLFEVGLETDIGRVAKSGVAVFLSALFGVITPLILGFAISYWVLGLSMIVSLFIGGALTATSIGITLRVFADLKRKTSPEAQIVLGAAIVDDVIGVVLLSLFYEFAKTGEFNLLEAEKILLFIVIFMMLAPLVAKLIAVVIERYDNRSEIPGLLPSMVVSLILLFAWFAHLMGAPYLLGGFAAGLALSKSFTIPLPSLLQTQETFSERVEHKMRPIIHIFTPIFFVYIGLSLNLREVEWTSSFVWISSSILLIVATIGKLAAGLPLIRESRFTRWAVGLAMIPRGEVGLIFADLGRNTGVFDYEVYAVMILVIALTTLIAPIAMRYFYFRTDELEQKAQHSNQ